MLKQIPRIDYDKVLTFEWLENVFNDVKGDIIDKSMLVIKINNEELCFDIDDRLMDFFDLFTNPLISLYHYSISSGSISEAGGVILKRLKILDCFVKPFHIELLKAFNGEVCINATNGNKILKDLPIQRMSDESSHFPDALKGISSGHRQVSLTEACSLFDRNVSRTFNSTSPEYVNAKLERNIYFKKVKDSSETSYTLEGSQDIYEKIRSNIDKYYSRINGQFVSLAEFVIYYDSIKGEECKGRFRNNFKFVW